MMFATFEQKMILGARCTDYSIFAAEYTSCKDKMWNALSGVKDSSEEYDSFLSGGGDSFKKYYMRECRIGSLRYLKDKKKYPQLFYVLKECEPEDMRSLIHILFEAELQRDTMAWQPLFFIMGHLDEQERKALAVQYFRAKTTDKEKGTALGYNVACTLHNCFLDIEEYYMSIVEAICEAIQSPEDCGGEIPRAFLNELEHRLKVLEKRNAMYRMTSISVKQKEAYFRYLCEMRAYRAANSFLDRYWKEDSRLKLFKMEADDVKAMLYRLPSPELLAWGKKYIQKKCLQASDGQEYTHEQWFEDISAVEDRAGTAEDWKSVEEWLNISMGINRLMKQKDRSAVASLSDMPMFDVKKYSYMTEMCCQLAEVIQSWMGVSKPEESKQTALQESLDEKQEAESAEKPDDKQLIVLLRGLRNKNLFAYELYDRHIATYRNYSNLKKILNNKELKKRMYEIQDPADLVYIYFHTPLWIIEDFYSLVKRVDKLKGNQSLETLLANYTIAGSVIYENRKTAVGANRFQLVPRDLNWPYTMQKTEDGKGKKKVYNNIIYIESKWLEKIAGKIGELSLVPVTDDTGKTYYQPTPCTFKVTDFSDEKGKQHRLQVFEVFRSANATVDEIEEAELLEPVLDAKEVFLRDLEEWFESICADGQFYKWYDRKSEDGTPAVVAEPLKVFPEKVKYGDSKTVLFAMDERLEIAERFLDVVEALAKVNEEELWKLLHNCSFRPLANVNEFRYIESQHWTNFTLTAEQEEKLYQKAVHLMEEMDIPQDLKLEIYMNTCIRKVYPLEKLIDNNKEVAKLFFAEDTEWIVPVKFEGHERKEGRAIGTRFSMESLQKWVYDTETGRKTLEVDSEKQSVIKTDCTFFYPKPISIPDEKLPDSMKHPKGTPNKRFVMYATMKSFSKEDGRIELNELFFDSEEVKTNFPWREYKKCLYDLKKLRCQSDADDIQYAERLDEEMLGIYDNLKLIQSFSMAKEHKHKPLDKCHQIIGEIDEVFNNVKFDIDMCRSIMMMLGGKNAFKDLMLFEHLTEEERNGFIANSRNWYKGSYQKFMDGIDDKNPNAIRNICAVFYLSHLQILVDEEVFIADVIMKHSGLGKEADAVRTEINNCKEKLNADIAQEQLNWEAASKEHALEKRKGGYQKKNCNGKQNYGNNHYRNNNYNKSNNNYRSKKENK